MAACLRYLLVLALGLGAVLSAQAATVLVVSSDRSVGYVEAATTFAAELERGGTAHSDIALLSVADLGRIGAESPPRLVLTLGVEAFKQVLARNWHASLIAALIPRIGFEHLLKEYPDRDASVSALFIDQPFGRRLDVLRLALPEAKRIGVLWGAESVGQQSQLRAAMRSRGMSLVAATVSSTTSLADGLRAILEDAEALLAVADPQVFNSATVSDILLATYRSRVPVFGFSPAYVRAGALLSLYTTPSQIGIQAAVMARQYVQTGALPANQYPTDFMLVVNDYVARSLGLSLDEAALMEQLKRLERRP